MWVTGGVPAPAELAGSIEDQFGTPPSTPSSSGSAASSGSGDTGMTPLDYRLPNLAPPQPTVTLIYRPHKKHEGERTHEEWDSVLFFIFIFLYE